MNLHAVLVAFAVAVAAAQQVPHLPAPAIPVALLVLAALGFALWRKWPTRFLASILLIAAVLAGLGYTWLRAELRLADALPTVLEGREITVVGVIDGLPERHQDSVRFPFRIESAPGLSESLPSRVSLAWWRPRSGEWEGEALPALRAGERWRWRVKLYRPHGYVNGHGFDLEAWLLENELRAVGGVQIDRPMLRLSAQAGSLRDHLNAWREAIRGRIDRALAEHPAAGVLAALAIGDQRAVSREQWALYNAAAISHLLSVSGAHVTLFAAWAAGLLFLFWRQTPVLLRLMPAHKAAAGLAALIAWLYAGLAGFEVPAQRTCVMLSVAALALGLNRRLSPWTILAWALAIVLLWDPWAVLAIGFWFSFLAVALLVYVNHGRYGAWSASGAILRAQAIMALGLAPLSLAFFQQVSLVGPLANAVAIPLVTMAVVPMTLLWILLPIDALLQLAAWLVGLLTAFCTWLASLPAALWIQHAPPLWATGLALIGVLLIFAPPAWPSRWVGLVCWLPVFTVTPLRPPEGEFRLTALDVGQGTAIVIETTGHTLLYDTGPRWSDTTDAGSRLIVPWLRAQGRARLDTLILSHEDLDHAGGAGSVLGMLPVRELVSSIAENDPLARLARARGVGVHACRAGETWQLDGVRFSFLHPGEDWPEDAASNDRSCVLVVSSARGRRALLTGDAEAAAEAAMLARDAEALRAEVLVVGHHGSRSSTGEAFLAAVRPQAAVVTVGHRNRYGHPHVEVLARLQAQGVTIHRTDRNGAIRFESAAAPGGLSHARREWRRYWYAPPP